MTSSIVAARRLSFIRETGGANRGAWVEALQRFCSGIPGDSWCADYVSFVLDVVYRGKAPLRKTGSTKVMLAEARLKGFVVTTPQPEDLYFYLDGAGVPHHVGIVTEVTINGGGIAQIIGIAGNTSEDGQSANGTGVFEHSIPTKNTVFVRLPKAV